MSFVLTTNAGLEDIVAAEIIAAGEREQLEPPILPHDLETRPWNCFGRVQLHRQSSGELADPALERLLLSLRSVHDVIRHHMTLPLPATADPPLALYESLRVLPLGKDGGPVPPLLGGMRTFRVSCVREGANHGFTSLDVEREVGGALHELYGARASMKGFDLRVRVDVAHQRVLIGTALHSEPLSRRHKLAFTRSVTLKPTVAYALLHLALRAVAAAAAATATPSAATLLDPCCGSGTLPLEAAEALGLRAHGVDKSLAVVRGAQANAAAAGLTERCSFRQGNARSLDAIYEAHSFDVIVTNAPWGVQTAKARDSGEPLLEKIYRGLLRSGHTVCKPGGAMVVLVLRWSLLLDLARRSGLWRVVELRPIRTSNLSPVAVVLERCDEDAARAQAQGRLAELTHYFGAPSSGGDGGAAAGRKARTEEKELEVETDEVADGGENDGGGVAPPAAPASPPSFIESRFCTRREYETWLEGRTGKGTPR
jgi:23S rRNA G2445 N2-methylase RlmL